MARAISSLPVPLSPVISTVDRVGATLRTIVEHLLHRRAVADNVVDVERAIQLAAQPLVVAMEFTLGEQAANLARRPRRAGSASSGNRARRAGTPHGVLDGGIRGDEQHERLGTETLQAAPAIPGHRCRAAACRTARCRSDAATPSPAPPRRRRTSATAKPSWLRYSASVRGSAARHRRPESFDRRGRRRRPGFYHIAAANIAPAFGRV